MTLTRQQLADHVIREVTRLSTGGHRPSSQEVFPPGTDPDVVQDVIVALRQAGRLDGWREGQHDGWPSLWLPHQR